LVVYCFLEFVRDVKIISLSNEQFLVIGCDSAGGIGPKSLDKVKVSGNIIGKFTARVALMEVLSVRAQPIAIIDTLSVEMQPTGIDIIKGIQKEVEDAGLDPDLVLTGSYEKNVPTEQTGLGVVVIGITAKKDLKIGTSKPGDIVLAIGEPKVGVEVVEVTHSGKEREVLADLKDVKKLLSLDFVNEILPVGSHGIAKEIETITKPHNLTFSLEKGLKIDLEKSAGPSTVVLVTLSREKAEKLKSLFQKPVTIVGKLGSSD
jgi:selenophosphate synthetase-related protein